VAAPGDEQDRIVFVATGSIIPNRFQPRKEFDDASLHELAGSIRREGVMQPVLLRVGSGGGSTGGRYELIAGERRWRAAKLAGLERIPALVRSIDDAKAAEWALIENVHRRDLNAMERAEAMASLLSRFGLTQGELADRLGLERPTVANLVRLIDLEPEIRALIASDRLSAGHGKALLSAVSGDHRVRLAQAAAAAGWSVRRLEAEAKLPAPTAGRAQPTAGLPDQRSQQRAAVISSLERKIAETLGTRVRIRTNAAGTKGRLEIDFFSLDHFEGLVRNLGIDPARAEGDL
jgi:ParB family chromosome partitioning protein